MAPRLSDDIERAIQQHHGCLQIKGKKSAYIVMSMDVFRDTMGVGTDEALQDSLAAIEQGLTDVEAGHTRPVDAFFQEFDAHHDIHHA